MNPTYEELRSQLASLRYATNAELSFALKKIHQEYNDPNKSILNELVSVKFSGGHGYVSASYKLKDGTEGYLGDDTTAVYLIDYAKERGLYE